MEKSDPPLSFGVFKPVGHVVVSFAQAADLQAAVAALSLQGLRAEPLVVYTAAEMLAQVDAELATASPLAELGQELNLIRAHRALAERGCSFLVVKADDDAHAQRIAETVRQAKALAAQYYGRFIVEELIVAPAGEPQVFESPERGLDLPAAEAPLRG